MEIEDKIREKIYTLEEYCGRESFIKFVNFTLKFSNYFLNKKIEEILLISILKFQDSEFLNFSNSIFCTTSSYQLSDISII